VRHCSFRFVLIKPKLTVFSTHVRHAIAKCIVTLVYKLPNKGSTNILNYLLYNCITEGASTVSDLTEILMYL
jgi:hypothetical protein